MLPDRGVLTQRASGNLPGALALPHCGRRRLPSPLRARVGPSSPHRGSVSLDPKTLDPPVPELAFIHHPNLSLRIAFGFVYLPALNKCLARSARPISDAYLVVCLSLSCHCFFLWVPSTEDGALYSLPPWALGVSSWGNKYCECNPLYEAVYG